MRDLLFTTGAPVDVLAARPAITQKLYDLSEGEPLLLRLYVEDLWGRGDDVARLKLEELDNIEPGLKGYFDDWLARQKTIWESEGRSEMQTDKLHAYLAVLACAYGPLTAEELGELVRRAHGIEPGFSTKHSLYPLRRFVIGAGKRSQNENAGYVLSHPKFGEFLREDYFDEMIVEHTRKCIAAWGREILRDLNNYKLEPEKSPPYLLEYLGQHFEDVDATSADFMRFVEEGWLRAWEAFEGGYRGFSQDVARACAGAAARRTGSQPSWAWQFRCQLALSSIASIGRRVPGALLAKCVEKGLLTSRQALYWAGYAQDSWACSRALTALARHLPEALLGEALAIARAIRNYWHRSMALAALAPHLSEELLSEALAAAREIENDQHRAEVLTALAPHLPETKRVGVLGEAFATATAIGDDQHRAEALAALAPHLRGELLGEALAAARTINDTGYCALALGALAQNLPEAQRLRVLDEAVAAAGEKAEWRRAQALGALAPHLPEALLGEALAAAIETDDRESRAAAVKDLAPHLTEALLGEALAAVVAIRDGWDRAEALAALAPHLPEALLGDALAAATKADWHRAEVLEHLHLR